MNKIKTFVLETDKNMSEKIEQLYLTSNSFSVSYVTKKDDSILNRIRTDIPDLIILSENFSFSDGDSYELCKRILGEFPSMIIIMTALYENANNLRKAMQSGARDLLTMESIDLKLIPSSLEVVNTIRKYDSSLKGKNGKVIVGVSPKGGVGMTHYLIEFCKFLVESNKKDNKKVLLLDFDLAFGDISYLLDSKPSRTVSDAVEHDEIDYDALEGHLEHSNKGFYFLAAPESPEFADKIDVDKLIEIIKIAKQHFDYIIVDTMSNLHMSSVCLCEYADNILLFTPPTLKDLKNAKNFLDILKQIEEDGIKTKLGIILTKANKVSIPKSDIERKFGFSVLGLIPSEQELVEKALSHNEFISDKYSNSRLSKEMESSFKQVKVKYLNLEETTSLSQSTTKKKGLLETLFGK